MVKLGGLGAVICLIMAFATSTATAAPEWLISENPLAAAVPVTFEGELVLEDMLTETTVRISVTGTGSVGPKSSGSVETITVSDPQLLHNGACTVLLAVEAEHLPWSTTLFLEEPGGKDTYYDKMGDGGKGLPGWLVECTTLLGKLDEVCTSSSVSPRAVNLIPAPQWVELEYEKDALTAAVCTDESEGLAESRDFIVLEPKNKNLQISG